MFFEVLTYFFLLFAAFFIQIKKISRIRNNERGILLDECFTDSDDSDFSVREDCVSFFLDCFCA